MNSRIFAASFLLVFNAQANFITTLVIKDHLKLLKLYLAEHPEKIDQPGSCGKTPLIWAAWEHKIDFVDFLLQQGCDPNAKDSHDYSALMLACTKKSDHAEKLILSLIKYGAKINETNFKGLSALDLAIKHNENLIRPLLENGAQYERQLQSLPKDSPAFKIIDEYQIRQMERFPLCQQCQKGFQEECTHITKPTFADIASALEDYRNQGLKNSHKLVQSLLHTHRLMLDPITDDQYKNFMLEEGIAKQLFKNNNLLIKYFLSAVKIFQDNNKAQGQ